MQKTNSEGKDQIRFNPRIRPMIRVFIVYHWSNVRIKSGLIFSPQLCFLHTAINITIVDIRMFTVTLNYGLIFNTKNCKVM